MSNININGAQDKNIQQNSHKKHDADIDFSAILAEIEDVDELQNKKTKTKKLTHLLEDVVKSPTNVQNINRPYKVEALVHDAINKIDENVKISPNRYAQLNTLIDDILGIQLPHRG